MKYLVLIIIALMSVRGIAQEETVDFPDVEAEFVGGHEALKDFVIEELNYPKKAYLKGWTATVYVQFIVEKDGSISHLEIATPKGKEKPKKIFCDEAIRVISLMPNWNPASVDGRSVRSRCRLPINFQ